MYVHKAYRYVWLCCRL